MTQHLTAEALRKDFLAVFGQEADQTFFSPGRINLIGEHTDSVSYTHLRAHET